MNNIKKIFLIFPTPFRVLFTYFFSLLLLINLWRFIFLFGNIKQIEFNNIILYATSFLVALRLDAVIASYISLPVFITIFLPYIGWKHKKKNPVFFIYFLITYFLYSFLSIIDIEFYKEFGTHLNILAFQSNAFSKELLKFAWQEYPIILYTFLISIIIVTWIKSIKYFISKTKAITHSIFINICFFFISFIIIGTCIRGGWQERPIDWGHAMFSKNQLANQVALNPLFNWGRSILQLNSEKHISNLMEYMENDSAFSISRKMILSSNEYYVDSTSLKRKIINPKPIKPHIILIVLESFLGHYCGFINPNNENVTPYLNDLAKSGINCTNTFASGKRSAYGLSSILCSWPVLPGFPLISQLESQKEIETIGSLLKKIGYSTNFIYGGDADFDNMKGFVISNGFDKVIEKKNFPLNTPGTMWGVFDEYIFEYAENIMDTTNAPTLISIFTTTNHQPWEIPKNKNDLIPLFSEKNNGKIEILRTMNYTDHVIGEFMEKNKTKKWYDNTIFIFIADHGFNEFDGMYEDPRNAHIPLIFYSPKIITTHEIIPTITSQVDVVPTILHLIDYPYSFDLMGKNIISNNLNGFASRIVNDYAMWIESKSIYTEIFNQKKEAFQYLNIYSNPYKSISNKSLKYLTMENNFHAYLQQAYKYYKNR